MDTNRIQELMALYTPYHGYPNVKYTKQSFMPIWPTPKGSRVVLCATSIEKVEEIVIKGADFRPPEFYLSCELEGTDDWDQIRLALLQTEVTMLKLFNDTDPLSLYLTHRGWEVQARANSLHFILVTSAAFIRR